MTEIEMDKVADKLMDRLVLAKQNHQCPFEDREERKKLHAFAEASTTESAGYMGRMGRVFHESTNKIATWITVSVILLVLGLFGLGIALRMISMYKGG